MSELNNNEKKSEQCKCTKKIMVLEKEIKRLSLEIEKQKHDIENIIKALKR